MPGLGPFSQHAWTFRELVVGARGFEPPTSCSQGRRANQAALRPEQTAILRPFMRLVKKLAKAGHRLSSVADPVLLL